MRYCMSFKWTKFKSVPKRIIILWSILFASFAFCTIKLAIPSSFWLDQLEERKITITDISVIDSRDIRGSRFQLSIKSNDDAFYLWYPAKSFSKYEHAVKKNLLTGLTSQVSVTYLSRSTIQDVVTGQYRIVDLRDDYNVFYDLNEEILRCQGAKNTYLIASILLFLLWIFETVLIFIMYGIVLFSHRRTF